MEIISTITLIYCWSCQTCTNYPAIFIMI